MKLKKLLIVEATAIAAIILMIFAVIEITPFLESSQQNASIGMYQEREYGKGNFTISKGTTAGTQFNYTTFDPAILSVNLNFYSWQSSGNLTLACNGRTFATVFASPESPQIKLTVITVSGVDWVDPRSIYSFGYGNEITFTSTPENGYDGSFGYQINIRGSR